MFDDLLDLLPEGTEIVTRSVGALGWELTLRNPNWQAAYTGNSPDEILALAWSEQTTYDTQQAIKQHNATYKAQLRALSEQNTVAVKAIADDHQSKKAAAIDKAQAAYKAKKAKGT